MQAKKRKKLTLEADSAKCPKLFSAGPCAGAALTIASSSGQNLEVEEMDRSERDKEEGESKNMQAEERLEVEG